MYADEKGLGRIGKTHVFEDTRTMQGDINSLVSWTNTWLMRLNASKCKVNNWRKISQYINLMSISHT